MKNKFSFIIPVYNEEKCIEETLRNISDAADGYSDDIEVIVVDAGSTDDSAGIASRIFATGTMNGRVLRFKKQTYPGAARNAGLKEAAYENVIMLDSGVGINKEMFLECADKAKAYDFIWFRSEFVFKTSTEPAYVRPYFVKRKQGRYLRHCCIRKDVIKQLGGFREDLRAAEDWLFYREVAKNDFKEYFSDVSSSCQGFSGSLMGFYRKWTTYFEHSVYAGLHKRNLGMSIIQLLFIGILFTAAITSGINWLFALFCSGLIYMILRGLISLWKSKIPSAGSMDILYTFITSAVLEVARLAGVIRGLVKNAEKS